MNTQLLSETKSSLKASPDLEDARYGAITQGKNTYTHVYKKLGVKEGEGAFAQRGQICGSLWYVCPLYMYNFPHSKINPLLKRRLSFSYCKGSFIPKYAYLYLVNVYQQTVGVGT